MPGATQWVRSRSGDEYIARGMYAATVWTSRDGGSWARVGPEPGGGSEDGLGSTWIASDDRVHILVGDSEWIVSNGAVASARSWSEPCTYLGLCFFDPTGANGGDAAHYGPLGGHFTLYRASCNDATCTFSEIADLGDTNNSSGVHPLLHTSTGIPVFVNQDVVLTPDFTQQLAGDTFFSDAVPLSTGGIAVAATTYAGDLLLHVSDPSLSFSHVTLSAGTDYSEVAIAARPEPGGPDRIFVVAVKGRSAHLIEANANLELLAEEDVPL